MAGLRLAITVLGWLGALIVRSLLLFTMAGDTVSGQASVTTYHNDNARTGTNLSEVILDTSNVNVNTFGKLFSRTVDGQIYAQPLYVPNVSFPGNGERNAIYLATEHNSVYAFDADIASASAPLWQVNLGPSMPSTVCCQVYELQPEIGITSTPVIDLASSTLYVVAETYENHSAIFRLHALDLATGADKLAPAVIQGSVPGTSTDSNNGLLAFNPIQHWQRPGLLLMNGRVYIGFGGHQDRQPYHGWLFSYSAATLERLAILCFSPDHQGNGVWQGGVGLAGDANGNIFLETGNGPLDVNKSVIRNYGDSIVKIATGSGLTVLDYFSPSTQVLDQLNDWDLGSSGPVLIPGTSLGLAGGKDGKMYVFNTNNLGQFSAAHDQIFQEWQATFPYTYSPPSPGGFWGGNYIFYNSTLYGFGERDKLKMFAFNGSQFITTPKSQTSFIVPSGTSNDPAMSISASGTAPETGILWAAYSTNGMADGKPYPGILRAFDASDATKELWNSNQNTSRDYAGSWAKFNPPTVVNGKVYLATFDNVLNVYGLLSGSGGGYLSGAGDSATTPVNLTMEGSADWVHWGDPFLNRKTAVPAQISDYAAVGLGTVQPYDGDPRRLSWTDGAPTGGDPNNGKGLFVTGLQNGFSLSVPADKSTRKLIVHVGGSDSGGTFTGHLSDSSAADFVDTTPFFSGAYDRNYTLAFRALSPGQTLTLKWVVSSGTGYASLNGAAMGASIAPSGGTPQSTTVNTPFTTPLQATVTDANSNPFGGVTVTFAAPTSGPSGTFGGSPGTTSVSVVTDGSGAAKAPTLTANAQPGNYTVTASVSGPGNPANFNLANNALTFQVNLSSLYNRMGIVTDGTTFNASGGLDGHGAAYSANLLGSAVPFNGVALALGPPNVADVVTNATVALPAGKFSTLTLLAAGVNGNQASTFIVKYTDGTSMSFVQGVSDWHTPQNYSGESKAVIMAYRNISNGTMDSRGFYLYGYSFTLDATKIVSSIALPNNNNVALFAITLTGATVSSTEFSISASPSSQPVTAGGGTTYTATITAVNGFGGNVTLNATGLPAGGTAGFSPNPVLGSGASTLTISTLPSTPSGSYTVNISCTSGSLQHGTSVTLVVSSAPDFSLSASPGSQTVILGSGASYTASVTALNGFNGNVTLSASGLPTGAAAGFNPNPMSLGNSTVSISTSTSTPTGAYPITISGTSGSLQHSAGISLIVTSASSATTQVNLSSVYNKAGMVTDGKAFSSGGLDGGSAYSANLLGSTVTFNGVTLALGPANVPDAVVNATVPLPAGQFSKLTMLATGVNGNKTSQKFTLKYIGGTSSVFTQSLSDWFTPQNYSGESKAVTMAYRDQANGAKNTGPFYLYGYSFTLDPTKTVSSITLPSNSGVVVFAITLSPSSQ